jgi:hypothetical protein
LLIREQAETSLWARIRYYCNPFDGRYEDLTRGSVALNVARDAAAGLVVAMVATDFLKGVVSALVLWLVLRPWLERKPEAQESQAA